MALTSGPLSNQLWTGLAADTKPTDNSSNGLRYGAVFFETDTGTWFLWNGVKWCQTSGTVTPGVGPVPPTV